LVIIRRPWSSLKNLNSLFFVLSFSSLKINSHNRVQNCKLWKFEKTGRIFRKPITFYFETRHEKSIFCSFFSLKANFFWIQKFRMILWNQDYCQSFLILVWFVELKVKLGKKFCCHSEKNFHTLILRVEMNLENQYITVNNSYFYIFLI